MRTRRVSTRRLMRRYLRRESGGPTIEFVVVLLPFLALVFFVMEVAFAFFFAETVDKAAHFGARMAIVEAPAVAAVASVRNQAAPGFSTGHCSETPSPCQRPSPDTWTCSGGGAGCDATAFAAIVAEMRRITPSIQAEHVTVTYAYGQLGSVGELMRPTVIVEVANVPNPMRFLSLFSEAIFGSTAFVTAPTLRAVYTAEDLSGG